MHKDELPKKRRSKRYFSLTDKKNFCIQWKASGLGRETFCKKYDLVPSALARWDRELNLSKPLPPAQNPWLPIVSQETPTLSKRDEQVMNIKLPKITHVLLLALCCILFLRGLFDAITIVW